MKLSLLQRTHRKYDGNVLETYADLFAGGVQFARNVKRYLPRHDVEPKRVYERRCASAHYVNYAAPIAGYFAAWLFTRPVVMCSEPSDVDRAYAEWKEDCDGQGTDLDDFLRARFLDALIARRAFWRVEFPAPSSPTDTMVRAEWKAAGLDRPRLVPIPAKSVKHWRWNAEAKSYDWILVHDHAEELVDLDDEQPTVTETWTQWYADGTARRWQIAYRKDNAPPGDAAVPEIEPPYNPLGRMPIVTLCLPKHLWLLDQMASAQLESFRKRVALSWAIDRNCYAMPYFFLADPKQPPVMGTGYYGILGAQDKIEWPAPPSQPFDVIAQYAAALKDEIYRVTHQMAAGIDNSAAAIGRSGESKEADNATTETVLSAFGAPVREAVERTYDLLSEGRGESIRWSSTGMDNYHVESAGDAADHAAAVKLLKIPSPTLERELAKRVAKSALPDVDEDTRQKINAEIDAGVIEPVTAPEGADETSEGEGEAQPSATATPPHAGTAAELPVLYGYDYEAGIVTVNEARARKALPPVPGGDVPVSVYMLQFEAKKAQLQNDPNAKVDSEPATT